MILSLNPLPLTALPPSGYTSIDNNNNNQIFNNNNDGIFTKDNPSVPSQVINRVLLTKKIKKIKNVINKDKQKFIIRKHALGLKRLKTTIKNYK